jgi:hypothetical protein
MKEQTDYGIIPDGAERRCLMSYFEKQSGHIVSVEKVETDADTIFNYVEAKLDDGKTIDILLTKRGNHFPEMKPGRKYTWAELVGTEGGKQEA